MSVAKPQSDISALGFSQIAGAANWVAASPDGSFWVLSTTGLPSGDKFIYHFINGTFVNVPGAATRIAVGPDGTPWVLNAAGGIYHLIDGAFVGIAGAASEISVASDGSVYVISNSAGNSVGRGIYRFFGGAWTQLPGAGVTVAASIDSSTYTNILGANNSSITVAPAGFYVTNSQGGIYYYAPATGWVQLPGGAISLAPTASGGLFALGDPGAYQHGIYYNDLTTGQWTSMPGAAVSLSANSSNVYAVSAAGGIYVSPITTKPISAALGCSLSAQPFRVACGFNPNAVTISTSEGAPYGDVDFWLNPLGLNLSNYGYGPTKVVRLYICLSGMVSIADCSAQPTPTGPLSQAMVNQIAAGIAAYQGTGIRVLPRFIYNFGPIGAPDASLSTVLTHLGQLAPVLVANKDLIFGLQAGFIGTWGEWHDSTNGNITTAATGALLDAELHDFAGLFPIYVRYPGLLLAYEGGSLVPPQQLGLHDDAYASSPDDDATFSEWNVLDPLGFSSAQLAQYQAAVSTAAGFVGEFAGDYATNNSCAALDAYSYTYHPQSFTLGPYPVDIGTTLQSGGCIVDFYNKIGTRIVLQSAVITGAPVPGGTINGTVTMVNAGYGRVVRQRPVSLVLLSNGSVLKQVPLSSMDLRTLTSSATPTSQAYTFSMTLPSTLPSAPLSLALSIADPAPTLSVQPAYALPLNSVDFIGNSVFNAATGYNTILTFTHQ